MGKNKKKETQKAERVAPTQNIQEVNPLVEMKDLLQRTQAQFENFRKQTEKRNEDFHKMAARNIITKLLPIVDNFDLALKNTTNHEEFVQGVELIHTQLMSMLKNNNVEPIDALHKLFNPQMHEALMKTESNEQENIIIEEFAKGYTMHDVIIRHAKVKVSAGPKKEEKNNTITEE
jgi:molecular chaperone GrpE